MKTATLQHISIFKMQPAPLTLTDEHPPLSMAPPVDSSRALAGARNIFRALAWRAVHYGRQIARSSASRCMTDELSSRSVVNLVI